MANKKLSDFPVVETMIDDDIFLIDQAGTTSTVKYKTMSTAITESVTEKIDTIIEQFTITNEDQVKPTPEQGFIKQLAKMRPSRYNFAAITSTNRVITWGASNGIEAATGGKLVKTFTKSNTTPPERYIRVPFHSSWTTDGGPTGVDYLDENPNVKVIDLYWNSFGAMALLSDGTCWVAGQNLGGLGVGADPGSTLAAFRPTGGFVKVAFPEPNISIKRIECSSDNTDLKGVFAALDSNDSLWVWGTTADGVFGTADVTLAETKGTPTKLTNMNCVEWTSATVKNYSQNEDFEGQILDFALNCTETTATTLSVVLKNNKLFISGDNTWGQRGVGFKAVASGLFNQAKTAAGKINDAVAVERGIYAGQTNHFYINTSGAVLSCGKSKANFSYLGNNTFADSYYFVSTTWPSNMIAEKILTVGSTDPTIFVLARDSTTQVKTVYSWGYNGALGLCGVNSSNTNGVNVPTQIIYRASKNVFSALNYVVDIYVSDNTATAGAAAVVIDKDGYAYTVGFSNFNDPPLYSANNTQFFIRAPLKNVTGMILGGDVTNHRWNIFLLKNGTIWGMGDPAAFQLFGTIDDVRHPVRLL